MKHGLYRRNKIMLISLFLLLAVFFLLPASFRQVTLGVNEPFDAASLVDVTDTQVIQIPADVSDLQIAINQISDGGIIEIAAGTYPAPYGGFVIANLHKGFTVRAAQGATVVLDGQNARNILRFQNTVVSNGGPVTFESIDFVDGYTTLEGTAAGVTVYFADATFVDCEFRNNVADVGTVGGAVYVAENSRVFFINTKWTDNSSRTGGGALGVRSNASIFIHHNEFLRNRTNKAYHDIGASGGALNLADSDLYITDSVFIENEAGAHGGALYLAGTWTYPESIPRTNVVLSNVLFERNKNERHPTVSATFPTEGGAINVENQTYLRVYRAQFKKNKADIGGAVNIYRATVEIDNSIFLGNQADGEVYTASFGGSISLTSADGVADGYNNRPTAHLLLEDSYLQGVYEDVGYVAHTGGCILAGGDDARLDGNPSVPDIGSVSENRAVVHISRVVMNDCDVRTLGTHSGVGGGILTGYVDLTMDESMIVNSNARGDSASGGGIALLRYTRAYITNSTIAYNTSGQFGGGLLNIGAELYINNTNFVQNEVSPGQSEEIYNSYGAAIFASPDTSENIDATGTIAHSIFSNNQGLAIYEDDKTQGPVNDLHYAGNTFYEFSFGDKVYANPLAVPSSVNQLNNLVIQRTNGTVTYKTVELNHQLATRPRIVAYLLTPRDYLQPDASGTPVPDAPVYLSIFWQGASAKLDGSPLFDQVAVYPLTNANDHILLVENDIYCIWLNGTYRPVADLTMSTNQGHYYLNWEVQNSQLILGAIDNGMYLETGDKTGQIMIPEVGRNYLFHAISHDGGVIAARNSAYPELRTLTEISVFVNQFGDPVTRQFGVRNVGGGNLTWSAWNVNNQIISILEPELPVTGDGDIVFLVHADALAGGRYTDMIIVDAGTDGNATVNVTIISAAELANLYMPLSFK